MPTDRGMWITWYDLPENGRDAYLSWLHEIYMPMILHRPGILWGAHYAQVESAIRPPRPSGKNKPPEDPPVPAGSRYFVLFGAEDANVFGDPIPSAIHAGMSESDRKMLAMRIGERVNIMAEAGRVEGPDIAIHKDGMLLSKCIQVGTYNTPWQVEEEILAWYTQGRLRALSAMPGCVRTRKLVSVSGWAHHGVLYEFSSLEAYNANFNKLKDGPPEMKVWGDKLVPNLRHAPGSANLGARLWPTH